MRPELIYISARPTADEIVAAIDSVPRVTPARRRPDWEDVLWSALAGCALGICVGLLAVGLFVW